MKYVFLVCNHMLYLTAMKVIADQKIQEKDVVFLYNRPSVKVAPPSIRTMDYTYFNTPIGGSFRILVHSFFHRKEVKKIFEEADNALSNAVQQEFFCLYLPHSGTLETKALLNHPLCQEFYFLEEGTLAYAITPENNFYQFSTKDKFYIWLLSFLIGKQKKEYRKYFHYDLENPKYRGCFSCNEDAFRGFPKHTSIGNPFRKLDKVPDAMKALIVFDGGIITAEQQKDSLKKMVEHIAGKQKITTAYFKFHPGQLPQQREEYRTFLAGVAQSAKIELRELADTWIIEDLAYTLSSALSIYIVCSSVGVYALGCGCRVFTTADRYRSNNPLLETHYHCYGHIFSRYERI